MLEAMNELKNIKCLCGNWLPDYIISMHALDKIESICWNPSSNVGKSYFE